jgi:peptidyl-prolyl cis-trans isomerase C
LARANSDCPSAEKGGDLGFITRGQTVPEFEKCAYGLEKTGQVSEVIKTSFGFHVLKLQEKRSESVIPFEEAQPRINQYLKNQKMNGEIDKYVESLFGKAQIESEIDL